MSTSNTNDRELLELAAKAAGLKIDKSPYNGGGIGNDGFDMLGNVVLDWHNGVTWNPRTDDGDAFRLGVRLNLFGSKELAHFLALERFAGQDADDCVAYRRALTRAAAAAIGRTAPAGG